MTSELARRRAQAVPRGVATAHPVFAACAENAEIWDAEGRRFVDLRAALPCSMSAIAIPK